MRINRFEPKVFYSFIVEYTSFVKAHDYLAKIEDMIRDLLSRYVSISCKLDQNDIKIWFKAPNTFKYLEEKEYEYFK